MQKYTHYRQQLRRSQTAGKDPSREGQLRAVAHRLGMTFSPTESYSNRNLLSDFELFRKGRNRIFTNIMQKADEWLENNIEIFDYQFETGRSSSRRRVAQTVFFIRSKTLGLPQFVLKPESFFDKIASYFGKQDIDFERFPKFSGQYLLQSKDEEYIRFKMTDDILHFFSRETGWHMEGVNFFLVLYKKNHRLRANAIPQLYERGMALAEALRDKNPII